MKKIVFGLIACCIVALMLPVSASEEVVVYSARKEHLIKPLFDLYTERTGVQVRYITDKAAPLLARLKAEGGRTPADIMMTVDAGNLWQAGNSDVLQAIDSDALQANVPKHLRDPENRWFGLSVRARTIVYDTRRVSASDLNSYEDLADPKWKGRLCLRTSKKVYNQSLAAMMIARLGEEKAEEVVRGWVANLATEPFSSDTNLMKGMAAGQCDVGIVNTYYFGRLQKEAGDAPLALFWPNQQEGEGGVHINVSGAGITKFAPNRDAAINLLEWLSSEEAQGLFAGVNMEYPANEAVETDSLVAGWGEFKADQQNLATAGELQIEAVKLMDRAGYR